MFAVTFAPAAAVTGSTVDAAAAVHPRRRRCNPSHFMMELRRRVASFSSPFSIVIFSRPPLRAPFVPVATGRLYLPPFKSERQYFPSCSIPYFHFSCYRQFLNSNSYITTYPQSCYRKFIISNSFITTYNHSTYYRQLIFSNSFITTYHHSTYYRQLISTHTQDFRSQMEALLQKYQKSDYHSPFKNLI